MKMRMNVIILIAALVALLSLGLAGCRDDDYWNDDQHHGYSDCSKEMDDRVDYSGYPEETNNYDSDGYHSRTYWYYCDGFSETFTWGDNVQGCEVSTNTFTPACD
jgi:hypothetical protein